MKTRLPQVLARAAVAVLMAAPNLAAALCAAPPESGRWQNMDDAGDPYRIVITLDDCGDQVLNGQQTQSRLGLRAWVKQSSGQLYGRPKVQARYVVDKGKRWLFAKVPTGGYVDNIWARRDDRGGAKQLYVFIRHKSLDSKPDAESKLRFKAL
ncbi:MAG: hypothetical protein ABI771_07380 [Betaproteobacteria bacterium]